MTLKRIRISTDLRQKDVFSPSPFSLVLKKIVKGIKYEVEVVLLYFMYTDCNIILIKLKKKEKEKHLVTLVITEMDHFGI